MMLMLTSWVSFCPPSAAGGRCCAAAPPFFSRHQKGGGGFGAERTDIEGKFLRTVIFPCIYQNAEHSAEVVELSVEDFVAEFYFIFIFISEEIVDMVEAHCRHFYIRANRCSSFYDSMFALTGWKTVEINGIEFELNSILVEKWKGKPYRLVIQRQANRWIPLTFGKANIAIE